MNTSNILTIRSHTGCSKTQQQWRELLNQYDVSPLLLNGNHENITDAAKLLVSLHKNNLPADIVSITMRSVFMEYQPN